VAALGVGNDLKPATSAVERATIVCVIVVDEGIDHDTDEFDPKVPIVKQRTAFSAKAETSASRTDARLSGWIKASTLWMFSSSVP